MFTPARMSEVDVFVFEENIDAVAEAVASLGVMHLLDAKALGQWSSEIDSEWPSRVSQYTNQERRVGDLLKVLGIPERPHTCDECLAPASDLSILEEQLVEIEGRVFALRDEDLRLGRQRERLEMLHRSMETLAPINVSIADLRKLEHLHLVVGTLPIENLERLEASLFRIPYAIIPVYRHSSQGLVRSLFSQRQVLVFAFCAQRHAPILDRALESAFLDPLQLPEDFSGTGQEVLDQVHAQMDATAAQLAEVRQRYAALADEVGERLLVMLTKIRRDRAVAEAMLHFGHRGRVYLIAGWVPKDKVEELRIAVENAAKGRATFEENPPSVLGQSQVPTLLRNPKSWRAVESIVSTYGVPGYNEIDPTLLVGLTFVLMFGIMFGDLGHGLLLAVIGALLAFNVFPKARSLSGPGIILMACGLSSAVFGLLYGSLFGMEGVIRALWLAPMKEILTLLGASVALGVVILNIGFGCRLITAVRAGALKEAVFDKNGIVGMALYWSLGAIVLLVATGRAIPGVLVALVLLLLLALFLAELLTNLIKGVRPLYHGNLAEVLVQAFFELLEALIGYISNTLSYVRLGAFAVAHAGLSMVVFMIADMLAGAPGMSVVRLLIIVGGNLVIVGFEGLIVAIQTLRLEYYELFGKFFTGEGTPYKPFVLPAADQPLAERA